MPVRKKTCIKLFIGLIILLGATGAIWRQLQIKPQYSNKSATPSITTRAAPEHDYSNTDYGQAINRAQAYLSDTFNEITPSRRLVLDFLQRKYGLNLRFSAQNSPIGPPVSGQHEDPEQFIAFKRIAYPNDLASVLPAAEGDPMSQMMIAAMQCDHITLTDDFGKLVQSNIDVGGYSLTHVAFSMQRIKENGCSYFSPEQTQSILESTALGMAGLAGAPDTIPDLRYESIAFILDLDRHDLARSAWMQRIVAEQQPDGGWKPQNYEAKSDDHSTILALWALLEHARPDAPAEPMILIRPPSDQKLR